MSTNAKLVQVPAGSMATIEEKHVIERLMGEEGLFLGKAWQALHWLLAGGDSFGESAVSGGVPLTNVDHGSAPPPQLLTPAEVTSFAAALDEMTDDWVRDVFDAEAMASDGVWPAEPELDDLLELTRRMRAYYAAAAAQGCGMLQVMT
jgi:hypothetical protein